MYKQEDVKSFGSFWSGKALESKVVFLIWLFLLSHWRHFFLSHTLPQFPLSYYHIQITTILTASLTGGDN